MTCNVGAMCDEMIREQLVEKTISDKIRKNTVHIGKLDACPDKLRRVSKRR